MEKKKYGVANIILIKQLYPKSVIDWKLASIEVSPTKINRFGLVIIDSPRI